MAMNAKSTNCVFIRGAQNETEKQGNSISTSL